jgi:hypothetical protein
MLYAFMLAICAMVWLLFWRWWVKSGSSQARPAPTIIIVPKTGLALPCNALTGDGKRGRADLSALSVKPAEPVELKHQITNLRWRINT